jgi:hypothetical protein
MQRLFLYCLDRRLCHHLRLIGYSSIAGSLVPEGFAAGLFLDDSHSKIHHVETEIYSLISIWKEHHRQGQVLPLRCLHAARGSVHRDLVDNQGFQCGKLCLCV